MNLTEHTYPYMKERLYQAKLDNGLTVFLLPRTDFHETYAVLTTEFGALHTRFYSENQKVVDYPAGIAHFLEHKLFERVDEDDVMNAFARLGANSNAYTGFEQTSYLFSTTRETEACLDLLQSFAYRPYFTEENVEKEQGIIAQEIEMYQDDVDYRLYTGIVASLYPNTPLALDIAGTLDSIREITVEALYENFETFYHPSNMTLFVIGSFDLLSVWKGITDFQNVQQKRPTPSIKKLPIEKRPILQHRTEEFEVATPKLALGLRGNDDIDLENLQKYRLSLRLLFAMLLGWTSKRYQKLYEEGKIDSSFHFQLEVTPDYHFLVILGDTDAPISLSSSLSRAIRNFESDKDVNEEHLQLLKKEMYGSFMRSLNSLESVANQFISYHSPMETMFDFPRIIQEISLEDVVVAGRRFIENCDMTDFTIFPS